ncbi:arginine--tRNA ligase [Kytococcus sedentarius]|uniref:Arginine--tRNA ligase n=1 Tax=Kytococcus sedentarius (strain ATCC 14392 / DSM 20547 / JCM 11482 / CCUG 33030 / NBRC 15357 / NCTC 11040 / CCM 314 / 541) TaxID=478801 RepID=C7NJR1_KYTSD|nr:arginine--tRNA ligase [Kytococcus sedentarius]ACV06843.1 arginyl-tRNA synthetase [Kytococcus sedentarius DSM 20547]QQB62866.1 arginine--tRNA ligase [Kytococcus sedentarius]STX14332.1 Arginine--tRNA ligase [Kytococcus sedentarius]
MTPEQLAQAITAALEAAVADGQIAVEIPAEVRVERPKDRNHGDWASNIALQLAKKAGMNPREFAEIVAARLREAEGVAAVDIAGPGFLNITLDAASAGELARTIVEGDATYGNNDALTGHTINLEFISANPTGHLHVGHTRWAALGDSMRRLLAASGADVTAEYYINDAGAQMDKFGASVLAAAKGEPTPEGGYPGEYVQELGAAALEQRPDLAELPQDEAVTAARELGYPMMLQQIKDTLDAFGVHFDVWFSEASLHSSGLVEKAVERLREQGHVYEEGGAVWLRTTDFTDDKDRVLVRANGEPTYFASDAAYYLSKKDRGFTEKIYLLGADHHGYVNRLKAISAAAGDDPAKDIEIRIGQLISINGARLSKRAGNVVDLRDMLEWIGADAIRYSLGRYPADTPLELDGEELRKQTNDNPVFYVQYAHARTANVARLAAADGVSRAEGFDPSLLNDPTEATLLAALGDFPRVVAQAAELREPHRVARYLEGLAGAFHKWYDACRVRPRDGEEVTDLHRSRLMLNDATGVVLRRGLDLLGVSAPERM